MGCQLRSQRNHVEVVETVDRLSQCFIVFILYIQLVESFVDWAEVVLLHRLEVLLSNLKSPVTRTTKLTDNAGVVDFFFRDIHEPGEQLWMGCKIVVHGLVHKFGISDLRDGIQENVIVPSIGPLHHDLNSAVMLLVVCVQVDSRVPKSGTFAGSHDLGYIELCEEDLAMLHGLFWYMLGIQDTKFRENSNVGILETDSLFEQRNNLGEIPQVGIVRYNLVHVIRILDDFKTASSSEPEFFRT
mmetsp:Transcript_31171/g.51962  ORF Transcript_31171/g.51962 Transcript_31171/m.51962 type:complete len:243 (+) Transcript_31171:665-1393(+)